MTLNMKWRILKMKDGNNSAKAYSFLKDLITAEELSKLLKVPISWIYERTRASSTDRIPSYKVGKYLRFSLSEIEDYLRIRSFPMTSGDQECETKENNPSLTSG